jgi:hypothetical protein
MTKEQRDDDEIDVEDLPQEGNSNARIYPPADEADAGERREEEDPQQAPSGDTSAVREGEEGAGQAE